MPAHSSMQRKHRSVSCVPPPSPGRFFRLLMRKVGLCRNWKSGCGRPTCKFRHPRGEGFFLPKSKYCYFAANEGRVCRRRATCPFVHAKIGDDSNQIKIGELQKEVNEAYEQLAAAQKCMGTLQAVVEGRERERVCGITKRMGSIDWNNICLLYSKRRACQRSEKYRNLAPSWCAYLLAS